MDNTYAFLTGAFTRCIVRLSLVLLVLFSAGSAQAQQLTPEQKTEAKAKYHRTPKGTPVVYSSPAAHQRPAAAPNAAAPKVTATPAPKAPPARPARTRKAPTGSSPQPPTADPVR